MVKNDISSDTLTNKGVLTLIINLWTRVQIKHQDKSYKDKQEKIISPNTLILSFPFVGLSLKPQASV